MKDIDELNEKINSLEQEIDKLNAITKFEKPEKAKISLFNKTSLKSPIVYYFALPVTISILLFLIDFIHDLDSFK
jgi:hypothetical protein